MAVNNAQGETSPPPTQVQFDGTPDTFSVTHKGSVSTAITPRGGLQLAHRRHAPPFVLRNGLTPDHHLAEM